jgi:MFS family permease
MKKSQELYGPTFFLAFTYNFFMSLNFTNNAIYPLYIKEAGGSAETIGYFMGLLALTAVISRPIIGMSIDKFGVKSVLIFGSLAMTLPSIGYWYFLDQGLNSTVWIIRTFQGVGFGAHFSAFFTLAAQTAPEGRRNESIAMFGFSGLLGHICGPLLGENIYEAYGAGAFFLLITVFGLFALIFLSLIKVKTIDVAVSNKISLAGTLKLLLLPKLRMVFILAILLAVCFSTAQYFIAPLSKTRMIINFGLYFTGYSIGGMGIRLLGKHWGDKYGVRRVMLPAFLSYSLGMIIIFNSPTALVLLAAGIFSGIGHGLAFPAVHSLGFSLAPKEYSGSVMALVTGMFDAGCMLTAFLFGFIAERSSYDILFVIAASFGFLAVLLNLLSILRVPKAIKKTS